MLENFSVWFVVYTIAHFLLYIKPQRDLFHPLKLNPNYPPVSLILKEILRSARGVAINTLYSVSINSMYSNSELSQHGDDVSLLSVVLGAILIYFWADFHFYWTHRLLHTQLLYKKVHKIHHESYNPDPFSGLSMHWFESAVYFSAAPLLALVAPLYMFRAMAMGLLIFPLEGHWGFGDWNKEGTFNHYIHHAKFNWNYGSSPLWDKIMG